MQSMDMSLLDLKLTPQTLGSAVLLCLLCCTLTIKTLSAKACPEAFGSHDKG